MAGAATAGTRAVAGSGNLGSTCGALGTARSGGSLVDREDELVTTSFNGSVTVVGVEETGTSEPGQTGLAPPVRYSLLTEAQNEWVAVVIGDGIPANLIQAGDELDLSLETVPPSMSGPPFVSRAQSFVLSRAGELLVYVATSTGIASAEQDLEPYGISFSAGASCDGGGLPGTSCQSTHHGLDVTAAAQTVSIPPGDSREVGDCVFSFSRTEYTGSFCDAPGHRALTAFCTPVESLAQAEARVDADVG
jgi:hypothetical protein